MNDEELIQLQKKALQQQIEKEEARKESNRFLVIVWLICSMLFTLSILAPTIRFVVFNVHHIVACPLIQQECKVFEEAPN